MATIAILGSGGVGGFLAGALHCAGRDRVTVLARESTAAILQDTGVNISSAILGQLSVRPTIATSLDGPADLLVVATKATGLAAALERIHTTPAQVVPLLNGVEHVELLRTRFGAERVVAAAIRIDADRPRPGVIVQGSATARIELAGEPADVADWLRVPGVDVRTGATEPDVMWSKLGRLCPLALTTSASDRPLGFIREDPRWRSALENAVAETVATGLAEGASLNATDSLAELEAAPAELGSSMQRDLRAGRALELDAIAGAVVRAAQRHGVPCATVQWLADRVALRATRS